MPGGAQGHTATAARWWSQSPLSLRYALAASVTQVIYLGVLVLGLMAGAHYLIAIGMAQIIAIAYAFPVYRRRVFGAEGPAIRQLGAFLGVWGVGATASFIGVPGLVEVVGVPAFPAQVIVLVGVFTFSYLGHRGVTFAPRRSEAGALAAEVELR